eukprot:GHVS01027232.1.p1 GENE.GHVS01027232.1~~GHVS01027232.1.p1  ORF type:complete len:125 (-),score=16.06 GHVS01027232.1:106-480(-)
MYGSAAFSTNQGDCICVETKCSEEEDGSAFLCCAPFVVVATTLCVCVCTANLCVDRSSGEERVTQQMKANGRSHVCVCALLVCVRVTEHYMSFNTVLLLRQIHMYVCMYVVSDYRLLLNIQHAH